MTLRRGGLLRNVGGGGDAVAAGVTGSVQYNNANAFAAMSGWSWTDATRSLTVTQGTQTAFAPAFTVSATYNNIAVDFATIQIAVTDTASSSASEPFGVSIGGNRLFTVRVPIGAGSGGITVTRAGGNPYVLSLQNTAIAFGQIAGGTAWCWLGGTGGGSIGFGSASGGDAIILRDGAANTIAVRNDTSAQAFRVYNTWTDASNYERIGVRWASNIAYVGPEAAGTGSNRQIIYKYTPVTVASLPSAATAGAGATSFVSDANATTFASVVAGGGANNVPVYSDGTNWRIG